MNEEEFAHRVVSHGQGGIAIDDAGLASDIDENLKLQQELREFLDEKQREAAKTFFRAKQG